MEMKVVDGKAVYKATKPELKKLRAAREVVATMVVANIEGVKEFAETFDTMVATVDPEAAPAPDKKG